MCSAGVNQLTVGVSPRLQHMDEGAFDSPQFARPDHSRPDRGEPKKFVRTGASVSGSTTWLGAGTVIRLAFSITCATASAAAVKKAMSDIAASCSTLVMSSTGWLIEDSRARGGDPSFRHAASYASVWAIGSRVSSTGMTLLR
jgi:hypothetical protein